MFDIRKALIIVVPTFLLVAKALRVVDKNLERRHEERLRKPAEAK